MATSYIGDIRPRLQLFFRSRQRRDPFIDQVKTVPGTKELLGAHKEVLIMLSPKHSAAILEVVHDPRLGIHHRFNDVETAADKERTVLLSECDRLLGQHRVSLCCGIVMN